LSIALFTALSGRPVSTAASVGVNRLSPLLGPQTGHVLGQAHLTRIFAHLSMTT
jgi:hypothetical protein